LKIIILFWFVFKFIKIKTHFVKYLNRKNKKLNKLSKTTN